MKFQSKKQIQLNLKITTFHFESRSLQNPRTTEGRILVLLAENYFWESGGRERERERASAYRVERSESKRTATNSPIKRAAAKNYKFSGGRETRRGPLAWPEGSAIICQIRHRAAGHSIIVGRLLPDDVLFAPGGARRSSAAEC